MANEVVDKNWIQYEGQAPKRNGQTGHPNRSATSTVGHES